MSNKFAIIGANESIAMLINKAKEMGYETHVFAWECGDPGEIVADVFYPISIAEKDRILYICKKINICGIASITSDFAVNTVNYVARKLKLIGNSERTDIVARNKYQMRSAFREAGLFTPQFYKANADFHPDDIRFLRFPVIVKPTDRWSSKGVTRVDSPDKLMDAVHYAIKESFNNEAIIEEFMDGPEYSAECICYKGQYHVLAFTQKRTTGCPHYIETGHIQPSNIPEEKHDYIKQTIYKALNALDIKYGAAHVEFRILKNNEIGIIEIGARMGGDCIGTDLTPISTGMDYIRMVVDIACGNEPCFDIVTTPSPIEIKFIINSDDMEEYENIVHCTPERIIRACVFDTNFEKQVVDSSTRHGYYIVSER